MTSTSTSQGYSLQRNSSKVIQPPGGRTADIFGRTLQDEASPIKTNTQAMHQQSSASYHHVELDKVGRGKRAIQPPGGQTADIFGRGGYEQGNFSSASSQAGSDVGSSRVHIETDHQSIASSAAHDAIIRQQQQPSVPSTGSDGQMSPTGSLGSISSGSGGSSPRQASQQQQQMVTNGQPQLLMAQSYKADSILSAPPSADARTPKKTIPVLRRNPITGEILGAPSQPAVVRVRQPPGGRSSGIF